MNVVGEEIMDASGQFQFEKAQDHVIVQLTGMCDANNLKAFIAEFKAVPDSLTSHVIFDCDNLIYLSHEWIVQLVKLQITLKEADRFMRFAQVSSRVVQMMRQAGVDAAFKCFPTTKAALSSLGVAKEVALDTKLVNPFLSATLYVLEIQASVKAEAGKIYLRKEKTGYLGDISGVMPVVSSSFKGSVVISFPEQTFLNVMSSMLGEPDIVLNQETLDGAGEITNMIYGQAKTVLNGLGYGLKPSLPTVVTGKDAGDTIIRGTVVVVPFTSTAGDLFVEICIQG